jgi:hypothetical protein
MSFTTKQMSVLETTLQYLSGENGELVEFTGLVLDKIRVMNEKKTRGRVAKDTDRVGSPKPSKTFVVESPADIETPSGWNGPHEGKYLKMMAVGCKRGVGVFATFAEALDAASGLDVCSGIMYDKKIGYQLRVETELLDHSYPDRCAVSWAKDGHVLKRPEKKTRASPKSPQVKRWDWTPGVAPDGWTGPQNGMCLKKNAVKWGGWGVGTFPTFPEAVEAANALDTCGGITYNKIHGYQLRVGTKGPITQPPTGEFCVSWVKNK